MAVEKKEVVKAVEPTKAHCPNFKKTLIELFDEPCAVAIGSTLMHQAFQIPGAGVESSLNAARPGMNGLKMVYHPGYGLIGFHKGRYFLAPSANVIVAHE